ncbi:MAG: protein kinase [Rhodothermia bacterium]|nr:protein kinase [Rhodothermia bacterium]
MKQGTIISHYRIVDQLGRGGMGIVYRAEDTKLDRTVALKLLPPHALVSEDDRARFYREARAAAALNHANIAHIYEIDEAEVENGESRPFIAMEYIDGDSLSEVIQKGPLPLKDAINYASQIAEGLKVAHEANIVHRDIKSGNVMLTSKGVVKILDFGLAKTAASTKLTQMGSTLGTVAYMSPEQAKGEEVDRRSDIWSAGVILYEMITGQMPFPGDYEQAIVYGILNEDPESLTALRAGVPMALDGIMAKLLAKDPGLRYQHIDELPADLKAIDLGSTVTRSRISTGSRSVIAPASEPGGAFTQTLATPAAKKQVPVWAWGVAAAVLLAVGLFAGRMLSGGSEPAGELMRLQIDLPHAIQQLEPGWSPDGSELYYLAQTSPDDPVHVRRYTIASGESSPVPGSEGADYVSVSPDGRWLTVYDANRGRFHRALRSGGEFTDIPGAGTRWKFGTYAQDGRFYFTNDASEIASAGESGDVIVHSQGDSTINWLGIPVPAADGTTVFFSHWSSANSSHGTFRLSAQSPGYEAVSSQYTFLEVLDNGYALAIPSGSTNQAAALVPIDPKSGELEGPAVPVARLTINGYAVSKSGHLVYRERADASNESEPLYRVASEGNSNLIAGTPSGADDFAAARNRGLIAIEANPENPEGEDIYLINLESGVQTRFTRGGDNQYAEWSPDDDYLYYRSIPDQSSRGVIMRRRTDATEPAELVLANTSESGSGVFHPAVTSDGSQLLFTHDSDGTGTQLHRIALGDILPLDLADARQISRAEESVFGLDPSPDDRYVVYRAGQAILVSSIDGQGEVEITSDGFEPVWSPDGDWIYFSRSNSREVLRVAVTTEPVFRVLGAEERVFDVTSHLHFDVASDGSLLVTMPETAVQGDGSKIWLVLNLANEAERIAPRNP